MVFVWSCYNMVPYNMEYNTAKIEAEFWSKFEINPIGLISNFDQNPVYKQRAK